MAELVGAQARGSAWDISKVGAAPAKALSEDLHGDADSRSLEIPRQECGQWAVSLGLDQPRVQAGRLKPAAVLCIWGGRRRLEAMHITYLGEFLIGEVGFAVTTDRGHVRRETETWDKAAGVPRTRGFCGRAREVVCLWPVPQ